MPTDRASGFSRLPGYPLAGIPELRRELRSQGVDVIDLGAGDADLDPPPAATEALRRAAGDAAMHRYPFQLGLPAFRQAVSAFMARRFGVELDPMSEVLPLLGSKEGIAHLPLAFLDPGDAAIMPDPGYQAYQGGVFLAGGEPHKVALRPENGFRIPLGDIPPDVVARARMLYLNYPNNPTTATASPEYLAEAVAFCREHDLVLVHDNAYSEIAFDGYSPPGIFQIPGARDVAIEFHSLSKTYNMTGWRIGWAAGNPELVATLSRVKSFIDTGVYLGIQAAGAAALESWERWVPSNVAVFERRRDAAVQALQAAGFDVPVPRATMYLWIPVPGGRPSKDFARDVLETTGVVVLPGAALGEGGEGFFRIALTQPEERLREAARRLSTVASAS